MIQMTSSAHSIFFFLLIFYVLLLLLISTFTLKIGVSLFPASVILIASLNLTQADHLLWGHLSLTPFSVKVLWIMMMPLPLLQVWLGGRLSQLSKELFLSSFSLLLFSPCLFLTNSMTALVFILEISAVLFLSLTLKGGDMKTRFDFLFFFFWISMTTSLGLILLISLLTLGSSDPDMTNWEVIVDFNLYCVGNDLVSNLPPLILIFTFFIKGSVGPLFIWKPSLFKTLTPSLIFIYVAPMYTSLILLILMLAILNSHLPIFSSVVLVFTAVTIPLNFLFLWNSFNIKTLFALSSFLNSSILLLMLNTL